MPETQGTLDGLCGIYAIINAVNQVYALRKQQRRKLFHYLIGVLEQNNYATEALLNGTYKKHITLMLEAASQHMQEYHRTTIIGKPLFRLNTGVEPSQYWQKIEWFMASGGRAVIINLSGRLYHWSVVRELSEISVLLEDSSGYTYIRKSSCRIASTIGSDAHYLIPRQTWGISISQ